MTNLGSQSEQLMSQGMPIEQEATVISDPVAHIDRILQDHADADAAKRAALLEDPRIRTRIETGQLTTAGMLAIENATGTSEPPRAAKPRRKPVSTRGGRSYSEGSESELDPNWTTPVPDVSPEEAASGRELLRLNVEALRAENAARTYQADIDKYGVTLALSRLKAKGFTPDPRTHGVTVIRPEEARKIRESK